MGKLVTSKFISLISEDSSGLDTPKMSKAQLDVLYAVMRSIEGICKDPIKDASSTIDEVLYGENGAWRGSDKYLD
jgi:hypothetical protein